MCRQLQTEPDCKGAHRACFWVEEDFIPYCEFNVFWDLEGWQGEGTPMQNLENQAGAVDAIASDERQNAQGAAVRRALKKAEWGPPRRSKAPPDDPDENEDEKMTNRRGRSRPSTLPLGLRSGVDISDPEKLVLLVLVHSVSAVTGI